MKAAANPSNQSPQSKANANHVGQQPPSQGIAFEPPEALLFEDKRTEAVAQQKLHALANNSPQVRQLRAIQEMANNSLQGKHAAQFHAIANEHAARTAQRRAVNAFDKAPIQRDVSYHSINGVYEEAIWTFVRALDEAVKKAWAVLLKTPTMGGFAGLDGYTELWVNKIKEFGDTGMAPGGLHTAFGYAVESLVSGPLRPPDPGGLSVSPQEARGGTRPDLVLRAGIEDVAWLDITASASAGHIFDKAGAWDQAPSYAEITYPSIGPSDLKEMAQRANTNPDAEVDYGVDPEAYRENAERARLELIEKRLAWKEMLTERLAPVLRIGGPFVPDEAPPRRAKTVELLSALFGQHIPENFAHHIIAGAAMNSSTYGFRAGFSSSSATGISFLLDHDPV